MKKKFEYNTVCTFFFNNIREHKKAIESYYLNSNGISKNAEEK